MVRQATCMACAGAHQRQVLQRQAEQDQDQGSQDAAERGQGRMGSIREGMSKETFKSVLQKFFNKLKKKDVSRSMI